MVAGTSPRCSTRTPRWMILFRSSRRSSRSTRSRPDSSWLLRTRPSSLPFLSALARNRCPSSPYSTLPSKFGSRRFVSRSYIVSCVNLTSLRTLSGLRKISRPFLTRIPSACASSRGPWPSSIPRSKTSPSRTCSGTSTQRWCSTSSSPDTAATRARSPPSTTSAPRPPLFPIDGDLLKDAAQPLRGVASPAPSLSQGGPTTPFLLIFSITDTFSSE